MCPSFRVTRDEQHLTRGRANTLRLALTGQLGPDALGLGRDARDLELCVSCKGCRRECPTGVDMAKMKIEFLHRYRQRHGLAPRDRLVAYLPRYAPWAARLSAARSTCATASPACARLSERLLGFSARRPLPRWRRDPSRPPRLDPDGPRRRGREVVLLRRHLQPPGSSRENLAPRCACCAPPATA